jgi:hypothetical protein
MADKENSLKKEKTILQLVKDALANYEVGSETQKVIASKVKQPVDKPTSLFAKYKQGGLFGIAKDVLSKGTKSKLEDSPAAAQVQPLPGLNNNKIKSILTGLMGLGSLLKASTNVTPKSDNTKLLPTDIKSLVLPANKPPVKEPTVTTAKEQTVKTVKEPTVKTVKEPTVKEPTVKTVKEPTAPPTEKHLIKNDEPQVFLLGGITEKGVEDLKKKMPVILESLFDGIKKSLKDIKFPEIKINKSSGDGEGGGIFDSLRKSGIIGTAMDFLKKKKGTAAGNIARNRKAKQLRAQRTANRSAPVRKTIEPKESIPKTGTAESKAARSAKAKELVSERAARKAETGTTLKAAEKGAEEATLKTAEGATVKGTEKAVTKGAEEATLKTAESTAAKGTEKAVTKGTEKVVTKETEKAAGKAVAKGAGKAVAKSAGKGLLKSGIKSGIKKIPGLGAIAGLGFGAQRALAGDWLGAAGEVASGVAGSIPIVGTAASVGIDAALAARDIYKENKQPEEETVAPEQPKAEVPKGINPDNWKQLTPEQQKKYSGLLERKTLDTIQVNNFIKNDARSAQLKTAKQTEGEFKEGKLNTEKNSSGAVVAAAPPSDQPSIQPASPTEVPTTDQPDVQPASTPAVVPASDQPSIQPVPPTAASTPAAGDSNPNKDILNKIAENTASTNSSIGALTQAVYKLAQSMGGKTGSPPMIINTPQKQDNGPSAAQVAAANKDPIRQVRSQFAVN